MKSVQVLLSSYNGEKYIRRQIDSILNQRDVDIHLLIRDDGSKDQTRKIILEYADKYPNQVEVELGENLGWKKSFFRLLQDAGTYDYYAFSDQDDFWYEDKECSSVILMEEDTVDCAKLVQVNCRTTDKNLNPITPQPPKRPVFPAHHDAIYAEEFFQGCSMTWNKKAMELLQRYRPMGNYGHDYWVGVVCYLLGKIYFINQVKFDYIRYETSVSTTGQPHRGQWLRLKRFIKGDKDIYYNVGGDLLSGYNLELSLHDRKVCTFFKNYKNNIYAKMYILLNPYIRRNSFSGTIFFKLNILLNRI